VNLVRLKADETVALVVVTKDFPENKFPFFVTRRGLVKKADLTAFSNIRSAGLLALRVEDGDSLVKVMVTDGGKDVLLATAQGMAIRFPEADVRAMGRQA